MPISKDSGGGKRFRAHGKVDHKKIKKARFEAASLTSPEFKVLLKNPASQFLAFERFNEYVLSHENKTPKEKKASYDLILEYLSSSPNCAEIFDILSLKDIHFKPEITHVLRTLDYLLLAVKKEEYEEKLPQAGDAICRSLAAGHLQKIFNLVIHGKGKVVEAALNLLTTVANHSSAATRLLFSGITFVREEVHALYNESGAAKLRQPFIKLLLALVNNASPPVLKAIIDEKGLLNGMLTQLHSDSVELIEQVLSTFDSKILCNRLVTKTQRIRLFNETTIPHILQCYHWKKSVKRETTKEKSLSKSESGLQKKVCDFVKTLLSDQKNGITFTDLEYGQGEKNLNHVLNLVLCKSALKSAYTDERLEEVVLASLTTRPGQLHRYMAMLNESALLVKNADSWVAAANHVVKLMYSLPSFSHYVSPSSSMKEETLCNIALALTSPPLATMKIFKHVLNMADTGWQYISLGLLLVVMKRAKAAVDTVRLALSTDKFDSWRSLFVEKFMQLVPQIDVILHCWTAINKTVNDKAYMQLRANYAGRVLDLLVIHLELSSVSLHQSSMPINVSAILQDIENMATHDTRADKNSTFAALTVKALQLLGELGEEAGLAVMRMQKEKKSTLSRILELIYSGTDDEIALQSKQLLIKQLKQSSWFEKLEAELEVWFYYGDRLRDSLDFLEKLLQTLFSNPYPYLDQVYEAMSAACEHAKQGRTASNKPLPFSPIVTIALKLFSEYNKPAKAIQKYIQSCMSEILLLQDDPLPLSFLISKHKSVGLVAVAETLLRPKMVAARGCTLPPYSGLWNLFFCLDKTSPDADIFPSLLEEVKSMSDTRSQLIVLRYCLLALWHHQGEEGGVAECVERLIAAMTDKLAVCTALLQSGLAYKWYLSEHSGSTMCAISCLCNKALGLLQGTQYTADINVCLEVYKPLLLARLDSVTTMSADSLSVTLESLRILSSTYSSSQLFPVIHQLLLATDCHSQENYWTCVQDCTRALFSTAPSNYTDITHRLDIIDLLLGLDSSTHKYLLAYEALQASATPEVVPFSIWEECLQHSDCTDTASQLLIWLIRESASEEPARRLLDSCDSEKCTTQLTVISELLSRLGPIAADDEKFGPMFKTLSKKAKRCLKSEDLAECHREVAILKHLLPSAKEKHALKSFHLLNSAATLGATDNSDCLLLLLSTCHQYPSLYADLFTAITDNVSLLSQNTVDCIGTELSTLSMMDKSLEHVRQETSDEWKQFILQALRTNYEKESWLRLVRVMCSWKYNEQGSNTDLPTKDLLQLLTNHSKFLQVIMCTDNSTPLYAAKGELLSLMLLLTKLSPSACSTDHYPLLLGAYQATLAANDRKLLHLMYLYEQAGVSTISYRPYLWGSTGVSYYSIKQNVSQSLVSEPNVESVIECLDQELLHKSAYNLCLDRPLSHQFTGADGDTAVVDDENLYDPSFLLPLFAYIMRPDNSLNTRLLIDTGVMTFVLCCLTSHVEEVRAAARFILHEFRQHMESSYYSETVQGLYVLDLIKESISVENARISPVIAVFIARTLQLSPDEHMYRVCHNYLLIKPKMELELVPEFFRLFYSSSQKFAVERSWILSILLAGLREDSDFRLYEKLNIFKIVISYSQCSLCSQSDRTVILEMIKKACSLPASLQSLIKYNVLGWFSNIVFSYPEETENVLSSLKVMISASASDKVWFGTFCCQLVTTLISLLRRIRLSEGSDTYQQVLYEAVVLRRDTHPLGDNSPHGNAGLLSQYEVDTVLAYLPHAVNKYLDLLMRFFHIRLPSS